MRERTFLGDTPQISPTALHVSEIAQREMYDLRKTFLAPERALILHNAPA